MARKEILECDRCKAQISIPKSTEKSAVDWAAGWSTCWFGAWNASNSAMTQAGACCPKCSVVIRSVMDDPSIEVHREDAARDSTADVFAQLDRINDGIRKGVLRRSEAEPVDPVVDPAILAELDALSDR